MLCCSHLVNSRRQCYSRRARRPEEGQSGALRASCCFPGGSFTFEDSNTFCGPDCVLPGVHTIRYASGPATAGLRVQSGCCLVWRLHVVCSTESRHVSYGLRRLLRQVVGLPDGWFTCPRSPAVHVCGAGQAWQVLGGVLRPVVTCATVSRRAHRLANRLANVSRMKFASGTSGLTHGVYILWLLCHITATHSKCQDLYS